MERQTIEQIMEPVGEPTKVEIENSWGKLSELELIFLDHPSLKRRPSDFDFKTEGDTAADLAVLLTEKMLELGGVGLSANQVDIDRRVFVFGTARDNAIAVFNPMLVHVSKEKVLMDEGCLSFPALRLALKRPAACTISYQDVNGETVVAGFEGLGARIIQHEYDHMEGFNFTNHASTFKLRHEINKLRKKHLKLQRVVRAAQRQKVRAR